MSLCGLHTLEHAHSLTVLLLLQCSAFGFGVPGTRTQLVLVSCGDGGADDMDEAPERWWMCGALHDLQEGRAYEMVRRATLYICCRCAGIELRTRS